MELMNDNEIKAELDRIIASMEKCGLSGCEEEMFTMGFNHFKKKIYDKLREGQNPDTSDEALHIGSVVNWLPFTEENVSHYNRLAREGKLIKLYDTGEQRHVNDDNFPMAVVTHYREG